MAAQDWMPQGMDASEKDAIAAKHPGDDHMAAAIAWESWAATLGDEPTVAAVSTGAQSVTYAKGYSPFVAAMDRAAWHRSRAKGYAVEVGGKYAYGWDDADPRVIATFNSPPLPQIGRAQVMLQDGVVGPSDAVLDGA